MLSIRRNVAGVGRRMMRTNPKKVKIAVDVMQQLILETGASRLECRLAMYRANFIIPRAREMLLSQMRQKESDSKELRNGLVAVKMDREKNRGAMIQLSCSSQFASTSTIFRRLLSNLVQRTLDERELQSQELRAFEKSFSGDITTASKLLRETVSLANVVVLNADTERRIICKYSGDQLEPGIGKIGVLTLLEVDRPLAPDELSKCYEIGHLISKKAARNSSPLSISGGEDSSNKEASRGVVDVSKLLTMRISDETGAQLSVSDYLTEHKLLSGVSCSVGACHVLTT